MEYLNFGLNLLRPSSAVAGTFGFSWSFLLDLYKPHETRVLVISVIWQENLPVGNPDLT